MSIDTLLNMVSTGTLVGALAFAVVQVEFFRARRRRDAALALVQSYQSPEFARAIFYGLDIPDGLPRLAEADVNVARRDGMWLLMTTWESLGILVHRREISLELVEDFFSGPVVLSWRRFGPLIEQTRKEIGRDTYFEWFQWLAERIAEHESTARPIPAYIEHRRWRA